MKPPGVSPVISRRTARNATTIPHVASTDRVVAEASIWLQILFVVLVSIVFLVRLVAALYDQPSKSRH